MILAHAVMKSEEGEAWVEVKVLREGAPFLGRHLPPAANGKIFKLTHDLRLRKKLNISAISTQYLMFTLLSVTYLSEKFFEVVIC